jgi:hypothetical protein
MRCHTSAVNVWLPNALSSWAAPCALMLATAYAACAAAVCAPAPAAAASALAWARAVASSAAWRLRLSTSYCRLALAPASWVAAATVAWLPLKPWPDSSWSASWFSVLGSPSSPPLICAEDAW